MKSDLAFGIPASCEYLSPHNMFCSISDVMFWSPHIPNIWIFGFLPNIWCPVLWCTYHAYNIWITGVMLCTVHILNGITPRSTLEVGEPRPMDKLSCPLWNLAFVFVFLSYYFLLPCCLSSVIFSTTSIFSTKHCSPGLQELLMPDHLFLSHWCYQASKDPGRA